ncbi:MAG: SGNH/GDSL hydrolase family protein [Algoriphagus aquaeductus]|uniref:SGNH/GDSL hydrolase family protein n=1 Tax=Algoriphagus aquaeductus TaxID=475299 RepID=UPI0039196DAA
MYWLFKLRLIPFLPVLYLEAARIRSKGVKLLARSENVIFGIGPARVLVLGESTAAGVGASTFEKTLAGHLSGLFGNDFTIENYGRNGLRVREAYTLLKNLRTENPKKINGVILFLGANDCFRVTQPTAFKRELKHLINRIESESHPEWIYLADIPPVHLFPAFSDKMRDFLKIQRQFLQNEMIELARENAKIVFEPLSVEISPGFFSEDQIHPSDLGYQKIAAFAIQGLKKRNLF